MADSSPGYTGLYWDGQVPKASALLKSIPAFRETTRERLSEDEWVQRERSSGWRIFAQRAIAERLGIDASVVAELTSVRRCLALHDHNAEALAKCLAGA